MSMPPPFSPENGEDRGAQESDIVQSYSLDETLVAKQPTSHEAEEQPAFFQEVPVQSTPNLAPPVAAMPIEGMGRPTTVPPAENAQPTTVPAHDAMQPGATPVASLGDPLSRSSGESRRVRWGTDQFHTGAQPHQTQAKPVRGPTVSVKPVSMPESAPMSPTSSGGIKRQNHPGQINLSGLMPTLPTEEIPLEPINHSQAPGETGAVALEGDDNERFLALSRELNEIDEGDEADISDDRVAMHDGSRHGRVGHHDDRSEHERLMGLESSTGITSTGSDTSYDPAEDLDHLDLVEGETDGMPSRPSRAERSQSSSKKKGWQKVRHMLGINPSDQEHDDVMEKGEISTGATNTKSIPVETSTGIRGLHGRYRPSALERKAAKLVRAHKLYGGRKVSTPDEDDLLRVKRDHLPDSEASTPDALETAQHLDARPVPTSGVLGQLLQLYEQQRIEQEAGQSATGDTLSLTESDGVTGDETIVNDKRLSDVTTSVPGAAAPESQSEKLGVPAGDSTVVRTPGGRQYYASGRPVSVTSPGGFGGFAKTGLTNVGTVSQKFVKGVAAEAGIDVMDERPKAARSSAGTIGALIATTGNMIGAVSPSHAQLGPCPTRPGYTLDRYLLPEMNEKTLRRTAKIVRDAAPVPKSMRDSRLSGLQTPGPRTPGMWTPSGVSTQAGDDFNPYFAGASSNEKSGAPSVVSSANPKSSKLGSEVLSNATNRMSYIGQAGKNMLRGSSRPMPSNTGSGSVNERGDYFGDAATQEQIAKREWQRKLRKRKARNKKQEIYITMHVAAILKRQEFLLKFARAMMMFGAPTHRLESQMQQTANVLDVNCRCIYLPNLMLLSFGDEATHTTDTKFIKQGSTLDLTKLTTMHTIYWNVIHDKIGVERATKQLDSLMRQKPYFGKWQQTLIGGFASFFICLGQVGFNGSIVDACAAFILGAFLVFCQQHITSELYSNIFEIVFATLNSFIAMALHIVPIGGPGSKSWQGEVFCYNSIVSGSIVLILPGFIVLTGALELQSKNIISGSVRLVYAIIYSVLLGIGIKFGSIPLSAANIGHERAQNNQVTACVGHDQDRWFTRPLPRAWGFLTVPFYSMMLSFRNQAKFTRKELPVMVLVSCAGWVVANFAKLPTTEPGSKQDQMISYLTQQITLVGAMGSFTVGILSNIYGRFFDGRSFVVAVPGILYQLPTGLAMGKTNFITYAQSSASAQSSGGQNSREVTDGLSIGAQLLNVSLGMTIGLFCATIFMHLLGGNRVRGGGMFSF